MKKLIPCPQCKKQVVYSTENKYRPFCSERCQLLDLGDWASGKFAIPMQDSQNPDLMAEGDDIDGPIRQ